MTEPNDVLEAMARAAANATMHVPVTKEEWDALSHSTKNPFFDRVKAALRAARELGYELREKTDAEVAQERLIAAIRFAIDEEDRIDWLRSWFYGEEPDPETQYDAAPDLIGGE